MINLIKYNIPLDYFRIIYSDNNINDIIPCCKLVENIISKKSKHFNTIIYQSKYFDDTNNQADKGNIFQRGIEEIIQIDPSVLLNDNEKTMIIKLKYIIPSAINKNNKRYV